VSYLDVIVACLSKNKILRFYNKIQNVLIYEKIEVELIIA